MYPPGSYTFVAPVNGDYEFAGWGSAYNQGAASTAASAAFGLRRYYLMKSQPVTINVGSANGFIGPGGGSGVNTATNVTFPDGSKLTWTDPAPSTGAAGTVTGADVAIAGNTSQSAAVSAPSYQTYVGGPAVTSTIAAAPGGGMFETSSVHGTGGQIEVTLVGPSLRNL